MTMIFNKDQKRVKGILLFYLSILIPIFVSCDYIEENERLIKIEHLNDSLNLPIDGLGVAKNVLIEDFTGQNCPNCPNGTKVIEQLQETYGADRVIAVGLYSGPFGKRGNGTLLPLTTETGCDYYDQRKVESQPGALIDRNGAIIYNVQGWVSCVQERLKLSSSIKMEVDAKNSGQQIVINLKEDAFSPYTGRLQVWILEYGILEVQKMPDGTADHNYVHNHVFRTAVNGIWGDEFTINANESKNQTMTQPIDATWNTDNLSIVAFVYNDSGVEQVVEGKVKIINE